ncbi:MAG: hypothetical protein PHF37_08850 [Phycisphaerae bacterium]|nr:hypothetical protein [Phycisphaerae bacterium]
MKFSDANQKIAGKLVELSKTSCIDLAGAKVCRSSSRFCFGVEHGDYNGTELFGVGTDRFIWLAYKPTDNGKIRLFSGNFPEDGLVEFTSGKTPAGRDEKHKDSWARFAFGVDYILRKNGFDLTKGIEGVLYGNIPGGGMSRSASLTLNLILSLFNANNIKLDDPMRIVELAQAVENEYIGSPCGQLDQIMILFAKEGMGTYYNPANKKIEYIPLGQTETDFSIVIMDTGTKRPGLEKSTYKIRRAECEELVRILQMKGFNIRCLADIKEEKLFTDILTKAADYPDHCDRLRYIYSAQKRFYKMLNAWRSGDINTLGEIFRADGIGLRDYYKISGLELETMCDIARTIPGVFGERMLGGGDKGAAGAIVDAASVDKLKEAIDTAYPKNQPDYADLYKVHVCKIVDGIKTFDSL